MGRANRSVRNAGLLWIALGIFLCGGFVHGQTDVQPWLDVREDLLQPEEMLADLSFVVDALSEVHPATIDGLSPRQLELVDRVRRELASPLPFGHYWFLLNQLFVSFNDAHTALHLPSPTAAGSTAYVDLPLRWIADRVVAIRDLGTLKRGDLVLSIGGRSVDSILSRLRDSYVSAEADEWVRANFAQYISSLYVLQLEDLIAEDGRLHLEVESIVGAAREMSIALEAAVRKPVPQASTGISRFFDQDNLAVYEIGYMSGRGLFRNDVLRFFREVDRRGISRAALDVRRSPGGSSGAVEWILAALPPRSGRPSSGFLRLSPAAAEQRPLTETSGVIEFESEPADPAEDERLDQLRLGFRGDVYVMTPWSTFSAAGDLAATLQDYGLATVIGEPPGNSPPSYGNVIFFETPEIGLKFGISHALYERPWRPDAPRLIPDVVIPMTVQDFRENRDPVMEYLLAIE